MSTLDKAILIATQAHHNQKDRYGKPYFLHPLRMMKRMDSESEKIVAVLHDVVEKSEWTLEDLRIEGYSEEIIDAVDKLTKRDGEAYVTHIERTKTSPLSRSVKLADLEDNMDTRRVSDLSAEDEKRLARFREAWSELKRKG
jgi:(p)ppGpp synthase/HD superfamily hydrolase